MFKVLTRSGGNMGTLAMANYAVKHIWSRRSVWLHQNMMMAWVC